MHLRAEVDVLAFAEVRAHEHRRVGDLDERPILFDVSPLDPLTLMGSISRDRHGNYCGKPDSRRLGRARRASRGGGRLSQDMAISLELHSARNASVGSMDAACRAGR